VQGQLPQVAAVHFQVHESCPEVDVVKYILFQFRKTSLGGQ
jgi:hypothetical protein